MIEIIFFSSIFQEVEKYIVNTKRKYIENVKQHAFVAAPKGRTIIDVNKDLKDMFPAAFAPQGSPMASDDELEYPATQDDGQQEVDDTVETKFAIASPVSQGYMSQAYDSDDSDDYSHDSVDRIQPMMKSAHSVAKKMKRSNAIPDTITIDDDDGDDETASTSTLVQNQKQRNPAMVKENFNSILEEVVEIRVKIKQHEEKLKKLKTQEAVLMKKLEQNQKQRNPAKVKENFNKILEEVVEIRVKIKQNEEKLKKLKTQEAGLMSKLEQNKK